MHYFSKPTKYTIKVLEQKETVDVSDIGVINDSLEFTWQTNQYTFISKVSGDYTFQISSVSKCETLIIRDELGNELLETSGDDSINLAEGKTYTLSVKQFTNFEEYTIRIFKP